MTRNAPYLCSSRLLRMKSPLFILLGAKSLINSSSEERLFGNNMRSSPKMMNSDVPCHAAGLISSRVVCEKRRQHPLLNFKRGAKAF